MQNPFELIFDKLNNIENLLKAVMKKDNGTIVVTEVFNLNQAAEYVSLSKSAIYKKTSERNIPHFKQGKKLYFKRSELDNWLTSLKISTHAEIEREATNYNQKRQIQEVNLLSYSQFLPCIHHFCIFKFGTNRHMQFIRSVKRLLVKFKSF